MTPQQLKNSILQRAIEGKLVEQRPEDGTARELLEAIKVEKAQLIKEGKIKKTKPLPPISEDEIPFDVPEGWEWVRLGDITSKIGAGSTPTGGKSVYSESGIKFLRSQNIYNDGLKMAGITYISEEINNRKQGSIVQAKDILLNITGGSIGRCALVPDDFDIANINQHILIIRNINELCRYYIHTVLISPYIQQMIMSVQVGVSREGLSAEKTKNFLIPLPPLPEQKRIVAKIEKLLPLVDEYDRAHTKITELNGKFPEDMKKSILQYAIEGKLVEQRPEDGTAQELLETIKAEKAQLIKEGKIKKTKPLPPISEDEIPFDVPESWEWVRLGEVLLSLTDGTHSTPHYTESGVPFLSVKNISSGKIDFNNTKFISVDEHEELKKRCYPQKGDILLSKVGTTGIPVAIESDKEFSIFVSIALLKYTSDIDTYFFVKLLESPIVQEQCKLNTRGVGNKNWVLRDIANTIIPLPPLAEQKRIVDRIEQLLPLCDKLAALNEA
ncbi:Type I restriction-modification system, specificity subunit S [Anaerovibrio sp. JC8]|uniref:restriction endonuclease subunit S n=1 Tax=Anaerovibrio sp. JC8 TaxID=1240085 RepID=UPI000A0B9807|nr:restriction endonuclease subunit S [Anaerovibrio sp. JC8]ORU00084.1 Type I restriction-modification system, specificity subunit S [Anaerovibrio sp. JC8]